MGRWDLGQMCAARPTDSDRRDCETLYHTFTTLSFALLDATLSNGRQWYNVDIVEIVLLFVFLKFRLQAHNRVPLIRSTFATLTMCVSPYFSRWIWAIQIASARECAPSHTNIIIDRWDHFRISLILRCSYEGSKVIRSGFRESWQCLGEMNGNYLMDAGPYFSPPFILASVKSLGKRKRGAIRVYSFIAPTTKAYAVPTRVVCVTLTTSPPSPPSECQCQKI